MAKQRSLLNLVRKTGANGSSELRAGASLVTDDWNRIADLFGPFKISAEQLRQFPKSPGSDEEPWDVLLSMLAIDEHSALKTLSDRTGLEYAPEPRLDESASRFYETVPAAAARSSCGRMNPSA